MKKKSITSKGGGIPWVFPELGMGATINHWSDRTPATVIQVTQNGRRLVLQEDKATRIDSNGMSDCQEYTYERDTEGSITIVTLRRDGTYRVMGSKRTISLGNRHKYHDYSF